MSAPEAVKGNGDAVKLPEETAPEPKVAANVKKEPEVNKLFRMVMKMEASDLHLKVGQPPMMRLRGDIRRTETRPLTQEDMERLFHPILNPRQRKILDEEGGVDFSWVVGNDECRFRVSLFKQRGRLSLVSRRVNNVIPSFEKLGLPPIIEKLCKFAEGLVILAGVTGPARDDDRLHVRLHRRTEPLYSPSKTHEFVSRQMATSIARDRPRYSTGTRPPGRGAARPDVILIGERDVERSKRFTPRKRPLVRTIHAQVPATINRILDLFPPEKHTAIRQASPQSKAVVAQRLVKGIKSPRVPTNEIMIVNSMIRKLIAEQEDGKIPDAIRIGIQEGMVDFNENLRQLCDRGDIEKSTALEFSPNPDQLKMMLKGIKVAAPGIL